MEGLTLDTLATLQIELDLKTIIENRLHALNALGTPLTCAVYSEDGICLYAGNERVRQITPGEDGYERIRQPGEDLLCVQYTASNGWRYVTLIDYSGISATIDRVALRTWVIDGIIVAVALLLSMLLADSLLKHLRRLVDKFDAFAVNGHVEDLGTSPYRDRGDEMGRLVHPLGIDFLFRQPDGVHPAADVHAHDVRDSPVRDRHGGADGAALARVHVRHDANL